MPRTCSPGCRSSRPGQACARSPRSASTGTRARPNACWSASWMRRWCCRSMAHPARGIASSIPSVSTRPADWRSPSSSPFGAVTPSRRGTWRWRRTSPSSRSRRACRSSRSGTSCLRSGPRSNGRSAPIPPLGVEIACALERFWTTGHNREGIDAFDALLAHEALGELREGAGAALQGRGQVLERRLCRRHGGLRRGHRDPPAVGPAGIRGPPAAAQRRGGTPATGLRACAAVAGRGRGDGRNGALPSGPDHRAVDQGRSGVRGFTDRRGLRAPARRRRLRRRQLPTSGGSGVSTSSSPIGASSSAASMSSAPRLERRCASRRSSTIGRRRSGPCRCSHGPHPAAAGTSVPVGSGAASKPRASVAAEPGDGRSRRSRLREELAAVGGDAFLAGRGSRPIDVACRDGHRGHRVRSTSVQRTEVEGDQVERWAPRQSGEGSWPRRWPSCRRSRAPPARTRR